MVERSRSAGRGWGLLRLVVLAAPGMARLPRGNGVSSALAMAGGDTVSDGIRGGSTLHLGLWLDRTRNSCAFRSASEISGSRFLPLRAQSDVRGFRCWLDRAVDRLRTRQSKSDRRSCSGRSRRASVCCLLRRADTAQEVRRGLRRLLPEGQALVAALTSVEQEVNFRPYLCQAPGNE